MREEYKNILDEMVINKKVINQSINGRNLLMYLQAHNVINYQEKEKLYKMGPTDSVLHLIKIVLQSKNDEDMIHFLNSLEQAQYKDAYVWLKLKITSAQSTSLWSNVHNEKIIFKADKSLKISWNNLKVHYKEKLEFVESYWRQFNVKGILNMDTFYNHNIVISNEKYKQIQKKIENFDNLFSTSYKRFIVMAEAGYGKSTFVHEMARQWVKGDKDWTSKFQFLFLFRLTEVNEKESKSLENLLTLCLYPHDASKVYNWLLKDGNMSKALFIFDGLDELRQTFCQEINEIIFGGKVNLETVVITSRQCQKLKDIKKDMQPKLYIELRGYTNEGAIQQLKKFSIPVDGMKKDLKNHLKIPLFNTVYCITHSESTIACTNICSSIHSFVNFAVNRYRNSNQNFTEYCGEQLLLTLGQAAQNKFSFIECVEIPYPNVSRDHLLWAVNSGLLHNSSIIEDLVFAHQTIAEYCAAYFWCKTSHLAIKECDGEIIYFNEPPNAKINYREPFVQFVCYLCSEFKEDLWQKFDKYIPIFDEYENLPDRLYTERELQFSSHSVDDQITIMNKLHFQENKELKLINGEFEPEKLFKTIRKLKKLNLNRCTFNIGAEEFFIYFTNVQFLVARDCTFNVYNDSDPDNSNPSHLPHLSWQELAIKGCSGQIETFVSFILKHSTFIKFFELRGHSLHDCGTSWINKLQNNKRLCISIEKCMLQFSYPFSLISIIETFKTMKNLKELILVFDKLTKLQANALADLLKVGLFNLKYIKLEIEMENQEGYESILKNLSDLSALTSLSLWNQTVGIFTTDTLNYLADIFDKLKLKQCELEYQEIFFEERIINSIILCVSLEEITFFIKKMEDSNFELFKKKIENKDRQLKIIKKDFNEILSGYTEWPPQVFQVSFRHNFLYRI